MGNKIFYTLLIGILGFFLVSVVFIANEEDCFDNPESAECGRILE